MVSSYIGNQFIGCDHFMRGWKTLALLMIWIAKWPAAEVAAQEKVATIVNPVRSRELWKDKTLKPIVDQYGLLRKNNLAATWLMAYGVLGDGELIQRIKSFDDRQEVGVFLEINKDLADTARVIYPVNKPWYDPGVVFLSGYTRNERRKMIDRLFGDFKKVFGKYPKSAGAWWIDSYSLRYLKEKYGVETAMIVADQRTTDNYGVWGQWWGVPYKASEYNPQLPAKLGVVIVQWALRDPERAVSGEGPRVSNYSLQANDYLSQGLKFDYFEKLAKIYLEAGNEVNQITVGLEVGQEATGNLDEFKRQVDWLNKERIEAVTMSQFGEIMEQKKIKEVRVGDWTMTMEGRKNEKLGEKISYAQKLAWKDEFVADKNSFLDRNLTGLKNKETIYIPYWIVVMIIVAIWQKSWRGGLLSILIWWPIFRSFGQNGWWVYFGPKIGYLGLIQAGLAGVGVVVFKKVKVNEILLVGGIAILNYLRITVLGGVKYVGFLIDAFRFIGVSSKGLVNRDFEGYVADSMLKFRWEWVWGRWWMWLVIYPLVIVISGKLLEKLPRRIRGATRVVLAVLLVIYIKDLLMADPIAVGAMR